jgi:hypothetical protein
VGLPGWVNSQVIKFPLNEYETATLVANNASYFSPSSLTEKTGVTMQATYTIKGDGPKGTSSTAVWNEYAYVYDRTNHQTVQQMTRRFAFDRKTGQLVNCCGANVDGNSSVQQRGYVGYVFPIGTQKRTYQVFDTTLNQPVPFTYAGTATVHGINTYKFVENIAPRQVSSLSVPGSFVGMSAAKVTLPEYYSIHLIYYVDPETGGLINVDEHQTMALHNPSTGEQALLLFDADLIATPASVANIAAIDSRGLTELHLLQTILPLILGIVGAIALVAGILLARKRRPTMEDELDAMSRKLTATSAERPASPRHALSSENGQSEHTMSEPALPEHAASEHAASGNAASGNAASGNAASGQRADHTAELAGVVPGIDGEAPETTPQHAESAEGPDASGPPSAR